MHFKRKALNEVRAEEVKQLKLDGNEPILKGASWLLVKRPEQRFLGVQQSWMG